MMKTTKEISDFLKTWPEFKGIHHKTVAARAKALHAFINFEDMLQDEPKVVKPTFHGEGVLVLPKGKLGSEFVVKNGTVQHIPTPID